MIVAVFRSHKNVAIHIPVVEIISGTKFSDGWKIYDTTKKVYGWYSFDKFRFDNETASKICLRGNATTQDRETETESKGS